MPVRAVFPLMLVRTAGLPLAPMASLAFSAQTGETALMVGAGQLDASRQALQLRWDALLEHLPEPSPLRTAVYKARRDFFQGQKLPAPERLADWQEQASLFDPLLAAIGEYQRAEQALQQARAAWLDQYHQALTAGYQALQQLAGQEPFQRALLFASHSLLRQLPKFVAIAPDQFAKKERQTAFAVLQYASRMALKTSPLSHFTTLSLCPVGAVPPNDELPPGFAQQRVVVTPNVALLELLYDLLLREPAFYRSLPLRLNPSLRKGPATGFKWLYFNGLEEGFQQAEPDPVLQMVEDLLAAAGRQMAFPDLAKYLSETIDAVPEHLEAYLLELTELGFLEWVLPETGLSPGWCGALYQYLGFLPAEPLIVRTASLLQWLRTAARTLPFQDIEQAAQTQHDAAAQVRQLLEDFGGPAFPVPAEQLFFEDVERQVDSPVPAAVLHALIDQLASAWESRPAKPVSAQQAEAWAQFCRVVPEGGRLDFLEFSRQVAAGALSAPLPVAVAEQTTMGALLQVFTENDQWYAVLNGMFAGGGKLLARWLPLFPATARTALEQWWQTPDPGSAKRAAFPWQGWFNANFQPPLAGHSLEVPGARVRAAAGAGSTRLDQLDLLRTKEGVRLWDREAGHVLELSDLGLEAPETRPPTMQLLQQLGVPMVSREALLSEHAWENLPEGRGQFRPRQCSGNLVLARSAWAFPPQEWAGWFRDREAPADFFLRIRALLQDLGVPRRFFAQFPKAKPQYFDQDSPLGMQFFEKILRQGEGSLSLTEMLPVPEETAAWRATEVVVEWKS
jgi:hypothetical protein